MSVYVCALTCVRACVCMSVFANTLFSLLCNDSPLFYLISDLCIEQDHDGIGEQAVSRILSG